jgi:uncharacterized repeat protein (TIGR04052 family)
MVRNVIFRELYHYITKFDTFTPDWQGASMRLKTFSGLLIVVVLLLSASAGWVSAHGEGVDITIHFAAEVNGKPATCGLTYAGVGTGGTDISLNDFRFYVSNVRLVNTEGEEVPVELTQDGLWQYENIALLDFEDGSGGCSEAGNPETNTKVVGKVHEGEYTAIIFDLGLPFELNHLDTTTAPTPLNVPAMWWNWQYGYKFVRIDLLTASTELPAWFIHLGSTGCEATDGNTAPTEACSFPNVNTIRLEDFNAAQNFVVADLNGLLQTVNLGENTPEPPGCMSLPDDPDCASLMPAFGINLDGSLLDTQSFFRVD